jgi:hypothetical protein
MKPMEALNGVLQLAKFAAKETYKCLGTGINEWIDRFVRQLERSQIASGF